MTSKNLFFKLMKEDLKRRLWALILASVVFFFAFPVASAIIIQYKLTSYFNSKLGEESIRQMTSLRLSEYLGGANALLILIAFVGAVICGVSGYAYLHSKKQVDFYHSLPVKRETLFFVQFVDGILIYLVPYTCGLAATYLISALFGIMTKSVFLLGLYGWFTHLMGYILCYLFVILATMLTGRIMITFLGIIALFTYAPAVYGLITAYMKDFFTTMYSFSNSFMNTIYNTRFLSPIGQYVMMEQNVDAGNSIGWDILYFVVVAGLMTFVNLLLYKKRASEKAGTSLVFKITEPIFRILISIPIGMLFAMIFYSIQINLTETAAIIWLIVGGVLGVLLAHGVVESLYCGDVKKCLSHKLQLFAEAVVTIAMTLFFFFDVFGFDSYLPDKADIASMAVSNHAINSGMDFYTEEGNYISRTECELENMKLTDIDAAYELAKLCRDRAVNQRIGQYTDIYNDSETYNDETIIIRYRLNNGHEVTRQYTYNKYDVVDLFAEIYRNQEYKKAFYPVYDWMNYNYTENSVTCIKQPESLTLTLGNGEQTELLKLYLNELFKQEFTDVFYSYPIAEIDMSFFTSRYDEITKEILYSTVSNPLYIYPTMTETIEYLRQHGFDVNTIVDTSKISNIQIEYQEWVESNPTDAIFQTEEEKAYYEKYGIEQTYQSIYGTITLTDPVEIRECFSKLVYDEYIYLHNFSSNVEDNYSVTVIFQIDEFGNERIENYFFPKGQVPQFIIEQTEKFTVQP